MSKNLSKFMNLLNFFSDYPFLINRLPQVKKHCFWWTLDYWFPNFQALLHYEEGLRLLNQALAIDIPKEGNEDEDLIKAHKTRAKMCRTRQQIVFRIHELKSKLNKEKLPSAPPSYDEVQLQGTI